MDDQATLSQPSSLLAQADSMDSGAEIPPDQSRGGEGRSEWDNTSVGTAESGTNADGGSSVGYGDQAASAEGESSAPSDQAVGTTMDQAQTPPPPGLDAEGGPGGQAEAPQPTAGMYEGGTIDPSAPQVDGIQTGVEGDPSGSYGAFEESVGPSQTPPLGLLPVIGVALIGLAALIIFFARRRKNWNDIGDDMPDESSGSEKSRHTTGHSAISTQFSGTKTLGETSLSHHSSQHVSSFD